MIETPETIKYPETFFNSTPANFDGIFDWSWTKGCFGDSNITPSDVDAIIERHGNFLLMETKHLDVPILQGQMITLKALYNLRCFTIMLIWGKEIPEYFQVWYPPHFCIKPKDYIGIEKAREVVSRWYEYANKKFKIPGF